eukprot:765336-Hanusia_phi.AAC.2
MPCLDVARAPRPVTHAGREVGGDRRGGAEGKETGKRRRLRARRQIMCVRLMLVFVVSIQSPGAQGYMLASSGRGTRQRNGHHCSCKAWSRFSLSRKKIRTSLASHGKVSPVSDDGSSIDMDLVGFWRLIGLQNQTHQSWNGEEETVMLRADGQVQQLQSVARADPCRADRRGAAASWRVRASQCLMGERPARGGRAMEMRARQRAEGR